MPCGLLVRAAAYAAVMTLLTTSCSIETDTATRELLDLPDGTNYVTIPPATTSTTITVPPSETTALPVGAVSPTAQEYLVKAGDSISKIAGLYDVTVQQIIEFNQFSHTGHVLHPGDKVRIPAGAKVRFSATLVLPSTVANPQAGTELATNAVASSAGCTHTIRSGENPSTVAAAYSITYDILQAANPDRDFGAWFLAGATIQIPPGAVCP